MKKLIRVSTDLKVTIHDYPEGGAYRTHNEAFPNPVRILV